MSAFTDQELVRSTASAIRETGVWIALSRKPAYIDDGAGGKKRAAGSTVTLGEQKVCKIGTNRISSQTGTEEGVRRESECVLLGMPFAGFGLLEFDVKVGDTFQWGADTFCVYSIHHDRSFQVKAMCSVVTS